MKKVILAALMCIVSVSSFAQVNFKSVEAKLNLRGDLGVGVGTTIGLQENLDIAPSFNAYFVDGGSCYTIDADFHYNFDLGNEFHAYPLAGLSLFHAGSNGFGVTKLGVNLGGGLDYDLNYNWTVFGEAKYQFLFNADGSDDMFLALGVKYRF